MRCARHPNVETVIRCGKCETPVCPDCSVMGPAGLRCRDCAGFRSSHLYRVSVDRLGLGIAAALVAALVGGYLLATAFRIGFFLLWGGLLIGGGVGEVLLRVTGRKRGPTVEIAAGLCAALGAVGGLALWFIASGYSPTPSMLAGFLSRHPFYLFSLGVMVFSAVSRIRFL